MLRNFIRKTLSARIPDDPSWFAWNNSHKILKAQKGVDWKTGSLEYDTHFLHHLQIELKKTVNCCKTIYRDGKWYFKKKYQVLYNDDSLTIQEKMKLATMKIDLLKMIPFSFFIIVPGAELTLPLCLYLFPNMIPSQFISKTKQKKSVIHLLDAREVYADNIYKFLFAKSKNLPKLNLELMKNPRHLNREKLAEFQDKFKNTFGFGQMDKENLMNLCRFTTMEPWTGFKLIGRLIFEPYYYLKGLVTKKYPKESWSPSNPVCDYITNHLLIYQLKNHLNKVREDDYLLVGEDLDSIDEFTLNILCWERGIETEDTTPDQMKSELKDWIEYSTKIFKRGKTSNEFMILTQIFPYLQDFADYDSIIEAVIEPSKARTDKLLKEMDLKKYYDFDKSAIEDIFLMVNAYAPSELPEKERKDCIETLNLAIDEKHFPAIEDKIRVIIKALQEVSTEKVQVDFDI